MVTREAMAAFGGKTKAKLVCIAGFAIIILNIFTIEHILTSGTDLTCTVSPRMP